MQARLLIPGSEKPTYLIDCNSLVELDNRHRYPPPPPLFTTAERTAIWAGLESLAEQGRLKLISQVREELKRWDLEALTRLSVYDGQRITVRRTPELVLEYQRILTTYPDLQKSVKPRRDPSDGWLIVVARLKGYSVISQERRINERYVRRGQTPPQNPELRIPDVCDKSDVQVTCFKLREVASREGWLS